MRYLRLAGWFTALGVAFYGTSLVVTRIKDEIRGQVPEERTRLVGRLNKR